MRIEEALKLLNLSEGHATPEDIKTAYRIIANTKNISKISIISRATLK